MHRVLAAFAVFAVLVPASTALAAGPTYVMQGGAGVLAPGGKTRYVALGAGAGTAIAHVRVSDGTVLGYADLDGTWGIPAPTTGPRGAGEGITRDGKRLVVEQWGDASPSEFAIVDTRLLRVVDRFFLGGSFAYDALSPDGSTLYLTQHTDASNISRYVVRAYDLRTHRLAPGRIADRTQRDWVMEGWAVTRATSPDGRWVYTLYQRGGGYPFVHALDTVNGVAHCIGLPWHGSQASLAFATMTLDSSGTEVTIRRQSGRPWVRIDAASWRLTHVGASAFPWRWTAIAAAGALGLVVLAAAGLRMLRRRQPREAVPVGL